MNQHNAMIKISETVIIDIFYDPAVSIAVTKIGSFDTKSSTGLIKEMPVPSIRIINIDSYKKEIGKAKNYAKTL